MIRFSAVIIIALFVSCAPRELKTNNTDAGAIRPALSKDDGSVAAMGYFKIHGDSLVIPSFDIEVSLSGKANEKLTNDKETIIVAAWFSGLPKDTSSKEYAESGEMFIKSARVELSNSRIANFDGIKFSKTQYDSLADKDIRVLINIYSGRRSTQDNLLDCAILSEKMSALKGQKFILAGKLIGEPDSLVLQ